MRPLAMTHTAGPRMTDAQAKALKPGDAFMSMDGTMECFVLSRHLDQIEYRSPQVPGGRWTVSVYSLARSTRTAEKVPRS